MFLPQSLIGRKQGLQQRIGATTRTTKTTTTTGRKCLWCGVYVSFCVCRYWTSMLRLLLREGVGVAVAEAKAVPALSQNKPNDARRRRW